MARRGDKPLILSSENLNKRKRVSRKQPEQKPEFDLPVELLRLIFSRLNSRDKARVSGVCKTWKDAVASVWEFSRPPVLMSLRPESGRWGTDGDSPFEYLNLSLGSKCSVKLPDRPPGVLCHANYGWMLFSVPFVGAMAFFNAETRQRIDLPRPKFKFHGAAFSAPPTSPDCVVFMMENYTRNNAEIITWRPGHTVWTTAYYQSDHSFDCCLWNCVVVRNGLFHCLSTSGGIGIYDPEQSTWRVVEFQPLKCMAFISATDWRRRLFMAEYKGDIFLVRTCRVIRPVIYKLDETKMRWVKVKSLGGATFFLHPVNSFIRNDMQGVGPERDYIYFPQITLSGSSWVYYSLRHKMYNICQQKFDPARVSRDENIWIDFSCALESPHYEVESYCSDQPGCFLDVLLVQAYMKINFMA